MFVIHAAAQRPFVPHYEQMVNNLDFIAIGLGVDHFGRCAMHADILPVLLRGLKAELFVGFLNDRVHDAIANLNGTAEIGPFAAIRAFAEPDFTLGVHDKHSDTRHQNALAAQRLAEFPDVAADETQSYLPSTLRISRQMSSTCGTQRVSRLLA